MHRRNFINHAALTAGLLSLGPARLFAGLDRKPAYKMKLLRNNVGIFTESGGTIAFHVSKNGHVVVDSEFPEPAQHLVEEIKKQGQQDFQLLINTHHHGDHTGGNISFKGIVAHVAAQENCLVNHKRVSEEHKTTDRQLFADITFKDTWTTNAGDENIKAHYFGAGHTNGDAIIHFRKSNIAHMGDLVFNRRYAYIDRTAGANIRSWISVLDKTLDTFDKDTLFIFGHSLDPEKVFGDKKDIKAMQDYLAKLLQFVERQIKSGKSREDILKAPAIPGLSQWKGDGIERCLTAAYEELTSR